MPSKNTKSYWRSPLRGIGLVLLVFLLYLLLCLAHATYTDYQPEAILPLPVEGQSVQTEINDSTLSLVTWNIGYCGLGRESDFFYHGSGYLISGGQMIRSPKKAVEKNFSGVLQTLEEQQADFYLLQEVDVHSKRSYFIDQQAAFGKLLPRHATTFAVNFDVKRVLVPIFQPWAVYGKAFSGLGTFSLFQPTQTERYQLPGKFGWPDRLFLLDRCLAVQRYTTDWGKELIVINLHNSAFDRTGTIKAQQMALLKELILEEYEAGNYVIAGGDWNQCPPGFPV